VLDIGESVQVKITEIDYDRKRVSLSIRALLPEPEAIPAEPQVDGAVLAQAGPGETIISPDISMEVAEQIAVEPEETIAGPDIPAAAEAAEEVAEEAAEEIAAEPEESDAPGTPPETVESTEKEE
jgi:hypothetical protein